MKRIKIGTRGSALALAQSNWVKTRLRELDADCEYTIEIIQTEGDRIIDRPLANIGGKGLFIKEIEYALLEGEIDIAVHSMKDMSVLLPRGLMIGAIPLREDPRDVLISPHGNLALIPQNRCVGTGSLRRKAQVLSQRPDLVVVPLRGNIDTRLRKLKEGNLDGIILAAAGLNRLNMQDQISQYLELYKFIPSVGQGALAIEIREHDLEIRELVKGLNHADTRDAVIAERGFLQKIEGSCHIPVGAYAHFEGSKLKITGFIGSLDGQQNIISEKTGKRTEALQLGEQLATEILCAGGDKILDEIKQEW